MPIPAGAIRLSMLGTIAPAEIFDCSFWFLPASDPGQQGLNDLCTVAATTATSPDLTALFAAAYSDTVVTEFRAYYYGAGGSKSTLVASSGAISHPGTGADAHPNQVSLVMTLNTGRPGRSYRGRVYLPATGLHLATPGRQYVTATLQTIANAYATFLTDISAPSASWPGGTLVVVSAAASAMTPVTQLRIDSRPDTQRRRANRQTATGAASATYPNAG